MILSTCTAHVLIVHLTIGIYLLDNLSANSSIYNLYTYMSLCDQLIIIQQSNLPNLWNMRTKLLYSTSFCCSKNTCCKRVCVQQFLLWLDTNRIFLPHNGRPWRSCWHSRKNCRNRLHAEKVGQGNTNLSLKIDTTVGILRMLLAPPCNWDSYCMGIVSMYSRAGRSPTFQDSGTPY